MSISCRAALTAALWFASGVAAQDAPLKAGDRVEAYDPSSTQWKPARITSVEDWRSQGRGFLYRVHLDDPRVANPDFATTPDLVRAAGAGAAAQAVSGFKTGDRVDVFYDATHGKNRGTIIETQPGKYKVHYMGCAPSFDEWVDATRARPPAKIDAAAPEIRFVVGKWAMFTPSYPTTVVRGEDVYREYGPGGKSPPLEIAADGTYTWYFDYGKPPAKGRWVADAKVEGADMGTQSTAGVLIDDPAGETWKISRWAPKGSTEEKIEARKLCSGLTEIGSRIR